MRWTIDIRKYLQLYTTEIFEMHLIELSRKDDPTPIIAKYEQFAEYLKAGEVIFLLKTYGTVIGYAVLEKEKDNVWYLQNLAVIKKHRGLGWGRLLINLRNNYAIREGAVLLYRHAGVNNVSANRLYEKLGFVYEEYINNHYGPGEHAYKMSKQLKEDEKK